MGKSIAKCSGMLLSDVKVSQHDLLSYLLGWNGDKVGAKCSLSIPGPSLPLKYFNQE